MALSASLQRRPVDLLQQLRSLGPVAIYPLQGTATPADASANALGACTISGSIPNSQRAYPSPVNGGRATSWKITNGGGADIFLTTPSNSAWSVGKTFSFGCWVRAANFGSTVYLFNQQASNGLIIYMPGSGTGHSVKISTSADVVTTSGDVITDNHWHFLLVRANGAFSSGNIKISVDGVEQTLGTITDHTTASGASTVQIGATFISSGHHLAYWFLCNRYISDTERDRINAGGNLHYGGGHIKYGLHQDAHYDGTNYHQPMADLVSGAGGTVSRTTVLWSNVQASSGASYDWSTLDSVISTLATDNVQALLMVSGSPTWLNGGGDNYAIPAAGAPFTSFVNSYKTFATDLATRYKAGGAFWTANPGLVFIQPIYEMWNEPNLLGFWNQSGAPSAASYVTWANAIEAQILAADPAAKVAVGAISAGPAGGSDISGKTYMSSILSGGINAVQNRWSWHPYGQSGRGPLTHNDFQSNFEGDTMDMLDLLAENGRLSDSTRVWLTEFGWQSSAEGTANQAQYLTDAFGLIKNYLSRYVEYAVWFSDFDDSSKISFGLYSDAAPPFVTKKTAWTNYHNFVTTAP